MPVTTHGRSSEPGDRNAGWPGRSELRAPGAELRRRWTAVVGAACLCAAPLAAQQAGTEATASAASSYLVGVASESGDIVTWLTPEPDGGLAVARVARVGIMPADIDGPHNVAVAPDYRAYYVTIAHGTPYGTLWKLDARSDTLLGRAQVELFPTTIALSPDGEFAFVANSDFHGDHPRMNVVSVVYTPSMTTITDVPVCDMPHGVKVNHAGTRVYISCMHSDEILEMDAGTFAVIRRAGTGRGHSTPGHDDACSPTFVSVSPDDERLYVACNHTNTLQVWNAAELHLVKEIAVGKGAYNVEPSPDGRWIVVTNKKEQSVSIVDAQALTEVARIPTSKPVVHGVAFSPDSRYAYISAESVGTDPGAVDVVDLHTQKVVSSTPVPAQPTGITIWRRASP